jgi:hypothetical protein
MKLKIQRNGETFVLKTCYGCGDEWYAKPKQNRCTLCGSGLVTRTVDNINLDWYQLAPEKTRRALMIFLEKAGIANNDGGLE